MPKFNIGDRIEWINSEGNAVQATVIKPPPDASIKTGVVWARWDDDGAKCYIDEDSVKLVSSSSANTYQESLWTGFILDNAEEIRELSGKHYVLLRKAFDLGKGN